ncbi:kynurenine 3-monooxygenase [Cadophora sp. MPI-SDFR-AT-0126]|nr:kynurenine 3-monooxygenase [Leotiomycetes sp. MPI-SDFR-AT-0126]
MSSAKPQNIAIIGAGLAGLTLSLALHALSIPSTIYELRTPDTHTEGALMLGPNALSVLSSLGIYDRIKSHGFLFSKLIYKDDRYNSIDEYYLGDEKLFGFNALRVYREVLLRELRNAVKERGIDVQYNRKFTKVISEDENGVVFEFADGSREEASILIGADGIHSKVRQYTHPDIKPIYSGLLAITSAVETSKLRFPEPNYPPVSSIHGKHGAFAFATQNPQGTEMLVGTQRKFPEQDKKGWDALRSNSEELQSMFRANKSDWPDLVQSAMENMMLDRLSIWPYYVVPHLDTWSSPKKRVVILGDAAHAIPPTAGQGASQAFEDVFSLALLLSKIGGDVKWDAALEFWQKYRVERVKKVLALTMKLNQKRLPAEEKAKLGDEEVVFKDIAGGPEQQRWLFEPKIEEHMLQWVKEQ